jgi:hypothetical protein
MSVYELIQYFVGLLAVLLPPASQFSRRMIQPPIYSAHIEPSSKLMHPV